MPDPPRALVTDDRGDQHMLVPAQRTKLLARRSHIHRLVEPTPSHTRI